MQRFGLKPDKLIGDRLEMVHENQVTGAVSNQEEAFEFVRRTIAG